MHPAVAPRAARETLHRTYAQMVFLVGMSPSGYRKWEQGAAASAFGYCHRKPPVHYRRGDNIVFPQDGEARETGGREELMALPDGHYRRFVELQTVRRIATRAPLPATPLAQPKPRSNPVVLWSACAARTVWA